MPIALYRIDDRLIHGQVVVGWGKPLKVGAIIVVDDALADSDWEQDLYRMGVPPKVDVTFVGVDGVIAAHAQYADDKRPVILLTGDAATMLRVVDALRGAVRAVNVGGVHHRAGRVQKLRYVFLTGEEEQTLRDLAARGVTVTAQDVPSARPVSLSDILAGVES
jgi:PTS system mannose-specific IIB component/fructoselysine and glucoselysine-specific PTS system IIB component